MVRISVLVEENTYRFSQTIELTPSRAAELLRNIPELAVAQEVLEALRESC